MEKRSSVYDNVTYIFGFLTRLEVIDNKSLKESVDNILKVYPNDLEVSLYDELKQFIAMLKTQTDEGLIKNPVNLLNWIVENNLTGVFPNAHVAFRLFLTIPVTNCEGDRSFSKLSIIKNKYRCTMGQSKLSNFIINPLYRKRIGECYFIPRTH